MTTVGHDVLLSQGLSDLEMYDDGQLQQTAYGYKQMPEPSGYYNYYSTEHSDFPYDTQRSERGVGVVSCNTLLLPPSPLPSPPPPTQQHNRSRNEKSGAKREDSEAERRRKQGNTDSQARSRKHNKQVKEAFAHNDELLKQTQQEFLQQRKDPAEILRALLANYLTCPVKQRPQRRGVTKN